MGEAILSRRKENFEPISGAVLEVETVKDQTVTVTCQNTEGRKLRKISNGLVRFNNVSYSIWTVSCTVDGIEYKKEIEIDTAKIYKVVLRGFTYGVQIDMSTTDYTTTYIDDAEGFEPFVVGQENPTWDTIISEFIGCKPCLVKDGVRTSYLQANDYTKNEDGSDADITSGDAGIAMVEFKKNWYKYSVENDILKFEVANYDRSADGFVQDAFMSIEDPSVAKDYLYYAAFPCSGLSGYGIYSGANNPETLSANIKTKYGSSYAMEDWTRRMYISGLLMLLMKDANPRFGTNNYPGYGPDGNTKYQYKMGCRNTDGLFADAVTVNEATAYYTKPPKMLGIEGFFTGNTNNFVEYLIDGLISGLSSSSSPYLRYKKFAPYGKDYYSDYIPISVTGEGNNGLYIAKLQSPDSGIVLPGLLSSAEYGIGSNLQHVTIDKSNRTDIYNYYSVNGLFGLTVSSQIYYGSRSVMTRTIMV